MLSELGRRIERLMYFGAILLVACAVEFYVVSTVEYVRSDNPEGFAVLASKIESQQETLQRLFDEAKLARSGVNRQLDARVQKNRASLGLPPERQVIAKEAGETYSVMLNRLVTEASLQTGMRSSVLSSVGDARKSPSELVTSARARQKELQSRAIVVWGIESPVILPFQYGSAQYQIPNWVLANLLLVALVPLCIGWFGSLYFTRQRELFMLRQLTDYKSVFPHLLNILPIVPSSLPHVFEARLVKIKGKYRARRINRIACSILRTSVLLVFSIPLILVVCYSTFSLLINNLEINPMWMILSLLLIITLLIQVLALIAQEWILLWKKEFSV